MKKIFLSYMAFVLIIVIAFVVTAMADAPTNYVSVSPSTTEGYIPSTTEVPETTSVVTTVPETTVDTTIIETTTPTTIFVVPSALCPEWWQTAKDAGWEADLLPTLDQVIHKESTCRPDAYNPNDPAGGSFGLTQINGYWCQSNKYNPSGWLQAKGIVNTCQDLFDPVVNLRAAKALYIYSFDRHGCGWQPWRFC